MKWYGFQKEALEACRSHEDRIWARQKANGRGYEYAVAPIDYFWMYYAKVPREHRFIYEMVLFPRPCHLYLDLEAETETNPTVDGPTLLQEAIATVKKAVTSMDPPRAISSVHIYEACSRSKISYHVIVQGKGWCWKDNQSLKRFMEHVRSSLPPDSPLLIFKKENGQRVPSCFIDLKVYSPYRLMRLWGSTKRGEQRPFLSFPHRRDPEDANDLENSLISVLSYELDLEEGPPPETLPGPGPSRPPKSTRLNTMVQSSQAFQDALEGALAHRNTASWGVTLKVGPEGNRLVVPLRERQCRIAQREHRSNHIYIVVDLETGWVWQKCHDEGCQGKRARLHEVEPAVAPWVEQIRCEESQVPLRSWAKALLNSVDKCTPSPRGGT